MKIAREIRVGNIIKRGDRLFVVLKSEFHKSSSGRGVSTSEMKLKVHDLFTKHRTELTIDSHEKVEDVILDVKEAQFLYKDSTYHFMNQETFEEFEMTEEELGDSANFLKDDLIVNVNFYEGKPVSIDLPTMIEMKITYTEPGLRGDTTGKITKPATLENGYEIHVPIFCNIGDVIRIDTRNSEYVERVS